MTTSAQEILLPTARQDADVRAARPERLSGRKQRVIGLLNNSKPNVDYFLEAVGNELSTLAPDFKVLNFVKPRSAAPSADLEQIAESCDFVINAVADCGSCTAWSVHDSIELEKMGVPTVTVVTDVFHELGKEVAMSMGAPDIPMSVIAHPIGELRESEIKERAKGSSADIFSTLMAPARPLAEMQRTETARVPPLQSVAEINDYFYERGWTDGLPIVPPTAELVQAFLNAVQTAPDALIGVVPPLMGLATVKKIAVNAAMAGCRPEYLPVVIAAVKAICHPDFNLLPIQATTNPVTPLVIVNGPIVDRLELNSGYNVLGQGRRANATIGRALRFVLTNIGGGVPGKTDKACHGQPGKFTMCIAENVKASPWEPLHVEKGFSATESAVSVLGVTGTQDIIHYARTNAEEVLRTVVNAIPREGYKNLYSGGGPLIIFGPEQAAVLGKERLSKQDIKRIIFQRSKIPLSIFNPATITLIKGRRAKCFAANPDMTDLPVADSEDDIQIMVAGGAGNHSVFIPSWGDTKCVTIAI